MEIRRFVNLTALILSSFVLAQSQTAKKLVLNQTQFQLRAGESVKIARPERMESIGSVTTSPGLRYPIRVVAEPNGLLHLIVPPTTPKGDYSVSFSGVDSSGTARNGTVRLMVEPMQLSPLGAPGTVPVVLLNGWQAFCTSTDSTIAASVGTFGQLAYELQDAGLSVGFFNNCAYGDIPIESLGVALGTFLAQQEYTDGTPVVQFDLVAHSMGGLIVRAYLSGLQTDGSLQPPTDPMVQKLILIATPNFGSFLAENNSLFTDFGTQTSEMIPGSQFLWNAGTWNQRNDDLRGVDALAIVGNGGFWQTSYFGSLLPNASDGLVSLTSASLGFAGALYGLGDQYPLQTRILPYCHVDETAIINPLLGTMDCSGSGIADAPETAQIVQSFILNTPDWMSIGGIPATDPYLSQYGGIMFASANAQNQMVTDVTQVAFNGAAFQAGAWSGTTFYDEFIAGTDVFQYTSTSLGNLTCGPGYTVLLDHYSPVLCKNNPNINSIGPLASTTGRTINAGATITINGLGFGQQCSTCLVVAAAPGAATGYLLSVSSWTDSTISAFLPATLSGVSIPGLITIYVELSQTAWDSTNIMTSNAQVISPLPGSTLSGSLADFSWSPVGGATQYQVTVGTGQGSGNIFSGTTNGTSQIVGNIPCQGGAVYVSVSAYVNGSYQPPAEYTYTCKSGLGDYNGDGYQDVIWQNNSTHQVSVHYFDGTEGVTFLDWSWLNSAGEPNGWVLVGAADFDGNGVPDLVWEYMPTGQVTVQYYGGPGGATFLGWNWLNETGNPGWTVVAVADMNGDGVPDLIWEKNATNQVTVNYYGGAGGATMTGWNWLNSGGEPAGWHVVAAADFDGNGTPDLVWQYTPTRQVTVHYYGGAGGATYQGWNWLNSVGDPGWTVVGANDFNGDGVPDLVWQNDMTAQVTVNYYGGPQGASLIGWNWLATPGYPGWTAVVPR
jgi:hypothetical protein